MDDFTLPFSLGLNDLVDIFLLATGIYWILLLIRGTRAYQVAWGLLAIIPLAKLAEFLELRTVTAILDRFLGYVVLAIIILFQDDIRRALARLPNSLLSSVGRRLEAPVMEELIRAVFLLASSRVGALIVLEREGSLDDYVEVGVRIDALVSSEVLLATFQTTSPIHDGAVIVRKDRIAAAGCFLPLTTNLDVSRALGTRHRAAIGLTDEADSVVLVVSEEEGRVSLVQGGRIRVMPDARELRTTLQQLFNIERPKRFWQRMTKT